MTFKLTDGRHIFYEIKGNEIATETIIFLNGLSQSTLAWMLMLPYFNKTYKILLLDFVFQGQSDKTGEFKNFDEHALDVIQLMQNLNIPKAHVCGISYGSLVAQHMALNYPLAIDRLFLMSTFAHKTEYFKAIELSWKRSVDMGGYNMLLDVMLPFVLGENYFENPIIPISIIKQSRQGINENSEALMKLMQATAERRDFREDLNQIKIKTLIIHGRLDKLIPLELALAVHYNIKDSEFKIIEGVGHTLNLEAVTESSNLILDFLKN